ncbi:hypothetical protein EES44_05205 [Streptomyces sp. ADI96-15]|nr:hypothetical protein EES44_05205 [Streptomyces sp. ADI96-15]
MSSGAVSGAEAEPRARTASNTPSTPAVRAASWPSTCTWSAAAFPLAAEARKGSEPALLADALLCVSATVAIVLPGVGQAASASGRHGFFAASSAAANRCGSTGETGTGLGLSSSLRASSAAAAMGAPSRPAMR